MYASCDTLFEIMDDFPGVLGDDGKSNAICFAIIRGVLGAIRAEDEEPLTNYHRALLRVVNFIRAQPGYAADERMNFLAGRLCGLFEVVDIALKRITPAAVISKIKDPKNVVLIEILSGLEIELGDLAMALGQSEAAVNDLLAELCNVVIIQASGKQKFVRLSLLALEALKIIRMGARS